MTRGTQEEKRDNVENLFPDLLDELLQARENKYTSSTRMVSIPSQSNQLRVCCPITDTEITDQVRVLKPKRQHSKVEPDVEPQGTSLHPSPAQGPKHNPFSNQFRVYCPLRSYKIPRHHRPRPMALIDKPKTKRQPLRGPTYTSKSELPTDATRRPSTPRSNQRRPSPGLPRFTLQCGVTSMWAGFRYLQLS